MWIALSRVGYQRYACLLSIVAAMLLLPCGQAGGQNESGRASIVGRTTDSAGAIIPGAMVSITAIQTGQTRTLASDGAGLFSFPSLMVGTYVLSGKAPGFAEMRIENLTLTVGQAAEINLTLKPESVGTSVTVNAEETDLTGRTETQNATVLDNEVVENLPTRGRNFTDFALLTPGISQEGDRFGLVVNGQRSGNSNISIDGVDFNDPLQNGQRGGPEAVYFFPQVAVREFQIVRTGASAEIGRTNAGFINVVTKSGTNRYHGEVLYTNRNPWLTWPDALNDPETTNNQNQFGGGIGGPILRDRLFFFAGVEKTEFHVPYFVRFNGCPTAGYYDPTNLNPNCTLAAYLQANPGSSPAPLPSSITSLEVNTYGLNNPLASTARLDWTINVHNTAMLQYMSTFLKGVAFDTGIVDTSASDNTTFNQQSQAMVLGLTTVFGSSRTNDARAQWVYDNRQQFPNSPGAEIDIGDLGNIGGVNGGANYYRAIREEAVDNYTWLVGKHSLLFGADINLEPETQQREDDVNGLWTIDTYADYLLALPVSQGGGGKTPTQVNAAGGSISFEQTLPYSGGAEPTYRATQREFAGYFQDTFHVLSNITLNMGFRYEAELEPAAPVNPLVAGTGIDPSDVTQWQPRLGTVWDMRGNGKTVVRASGSLFDARTPGYLIARSFVDNGQFNATLNSIYDPTILNDIPYLGAFGSITSAPTASIRNEIYVNNPAFRNPRSMQAALAVEQQITKRTAFVLAFTQQETWKLQHRLNTNLFTPNIDAATLYPIFPSINPISKVACTFAGVAIPCEPNPSIGGYHQDFSTAHATYSSLIAQFKGNITNKLVAIANFTWASSRDDDSNERDYSRELALDPLCTSCYNRGYSKQDIRDNFNLSAVYHMPYRFIFSTSFIARTALPYSAQTSGSKQGDFNNDGNTANDRPILCSQVRFTVCPVSTTQINEYKGGAEVGTVVGRNTFRQDGFLNWNMRLIKEFLVAKKEQRLQFSAECLNCSRSSNLNLGANAVSKFTHAQSTMNPITGYYYSGSNAGFMLDAYDTIRTGGPRQIQLGARYIF